jgi:hypothetical protein
MRQQPRTARAFDSLGDGDKWSFLKLVLRDMTATIEAVNWARHYAEAQIVALLTEVAAVRYGRPFSSSQAQSGKRVSLPDSFLTEFTQEEFKLHEFILDYRDQSFAHSDYKGSRPIFISVSTYREDGTLLRQQAQQGQFTSRYPSLEKLLGLIPVAKKIEVSVEAALEKLPRLF